MGKRLGQAKSLSRKEWKQWLAYVEKHASCRASVAIELTQAFTLRMGETLTLKGEDFKLEESPPFVTIRGGKSPGPVPILPDMLPRLRTLIATGLKRTCFVQGPV